MSQLRDLNEYQRIRRQEDPGYAQAIYGVPENRRSYADKVLADEGFTRTAPNLWVRGQSMTLSFDESGIARLVIWRGRKMIAAGGAEVPHQLRHLIRLEENEDS